MMRVLVAQRKTESRIRIQRMFASSDRVHMAADGKEALTLFLLAHMEHHPYDLILLDVMLEELNSVDIIRRIRRFEKKTNLRGTRAKIILTASRLNYHFVDAALRSKYDGWLIKPISKIRLEKEIHRMGFHQGSFKQAAGA